MPGCFSEGETLANLALKWDNIAVLTFVLEAAETQVGGGVRASEGEFASLGGERKEKDAVRRNASGCGDFNARCEPCVASAPHVATGLRGEVGPAGGCRQSADAHAEDCAHVDADFHNAETHIPYITADNGAARRDDACRLGMQVALTNAPARARTFIHNTLMHMH